MFMWSRVYVYHKYLDISSMWRSVWESGPTVNKSDDLCLFSPSLFHHMLRVFFSGSTVVLWQRHSANQRSGGWTAACDLYTHTFLEEIFKQNPQSCLRVHVTLVWICVWSLERRRVLSVWYLCSLTCRNVFPPHSSSSTRLDSSVYMFSSSSICDVIIATTARNRHKHMTDTGPGGWRTLWQRKETEQDKSSENKLPRT